jgi:hypothetical protein
MPGEFDAIEKPEQQVEVGGRTFVVRPLTIGQLPAFTRHIRPMAGAIAPLLDGAQGEQGDLMATLLDLITEHGDGLIEAAAIALRVKRGEIESLDPMEFLQLLLPVVKVNADFFARRLQPALRQAMGEAAASRGGGQTPSKP